MNELRTLPSTVFRNSARGIRNAWTFTPPALIARLAFSTFLSSMVTSARSMSDFAQTVSCDRLPQRMAARMDRSSFTCATRLSSASVNFFSMGSVDVLTLPPDVSHCNAFPGLKSNAEVKRRSQSRSRYTKGCEVCREAIRQEPGVCRCRGYHHGRGSRRQHRHLQRGQRPVAAPVAICAAGPAGVALLGTQGGRS